MTTKYKFIKYPDRDNKYDGAKVIMSLESESLQTIYEEFQFFLIGAGWTQKQVESVFGCEGCELKEDIE